MLLKPLDYYAEMVLKILRRNVSSVQNGVAATILIVEALYVVLAVAYITVFGVKVASGESTSFGFVEASSLPLVAVGVFAVWALALTHVVQNEPRADISQTQGNGSSRVGSMCGYAAVIALHAVFATALMATGHYAVGTTVLALGVLLAICLIFRTKSSKPHPGLDVTATNKTSLQ